MPESPLRDFERLVSVERIACLANEHRLRILGALVQEPRTGAQIAKRLGLRAPLVHYHLQRLAEHDFVTEVAVDPGAKGRSSERYFRASARHLFVDPALACGDDSTARELITSFEQVLDAWQRREILGVDLAAIAERVIGDALAIGPGDRVLLVSPPEVREIVDRLYIEAEVRGAAPRIRPWSRQYALARLDRMSLEEAERMRFGPEGELDELDAVVLVSTTQSTAVQPNEAQRRKLPHLLRALGEWMLAMRAGGVRYLELSVPARGDLEHGDLDHAEAAAVFWQSLTVGSELLAGRIEAVERALAADAGNDGFAQVELEDEEGGRLQLELDAAHPHRNRGRVHPDDARVGLVADEFPPGSIAWFPREGSGEGRIRVPYVAVGKARFHELVLELREGRIAAIEGPRADELERLLREATGDADALAELRVGVNPAGDQLTGKASLDAVLAGTVTLAFGSNEVLGGTRRATLDLRFPSRASTLRSGERVLVERGALRVEGADATESGS